MENINVKIVEQPLVKINAQTLFRYVLQLLPDIYLKSLTQILEIKKKDIISQEKPYILSKPFTVLPPSIINDPSYEDIFEKENIFYLVSGVLELHQKVKRQVNLHINQYEIAYRKQCELKEGSYFTLFNYKNFQENQPEFYKIILKNKCVICAIPFKKQFRYQFFREQSFKLNLLAKIFYYGDGWGETEKKKSKFKQFVSKFKHETYKRGSRLLSEGTMNEKVIIIGKGEVSIKKSMNYFKNSIKYSKLIDILSVHYGAVIAAEYFLANSKVLNLVVKNHTGLERVKSPNKKIRGKQLQEADESDQQAQKLKLEVKDHSKLSYLLSFPNQNLSNLTAIAESAKVQIYSISLQDLKNIISERWKSNFFKICEETYTTFFRRISEKISIHLKHQDQKSININHQIINVTGRRCANTYQHREQEDFEAKNSIEKKKVQSNYQRLSIKKHQILPFADIISDHLRTPQLQKLKQNQIEKKIQILLNEKNIEANYKEKIEKLLLEKVKQKKLKINSNKLIKCDEGKQLEEQSQQKLYQSSKEIFEMKQRDLQKVNELEEIFMRKHKSRTEDIIRQAQIINKKQELFQQFGKKDLRLIIDEKSYNKNSNKQIRINLIKKGAYENKQEIMKNYLKGFDMEAYTQNLKSSYERKIHSTNKIKQQFMKIRSECETCMCYENFEATSTTPESQIRHSKSSSHGQLRMSHTMKIGVNWKASSKLAEQESLEKVYNQMKFLSQRTQQKYSHQKHLSRTKSNRQKILRKGSAPQL